MFLAKLRSRLVVAVTIATAIIPMTAHAVSAHLEDSIADVLVWFVLVLVPILAIWIFWKLHVLPEVIAEKRHHPQADAIKALCLMSLVFGGMLWPFAWLWAYTKPVGYRLAYGRDKHDHYYQEISATEDNTATESKTGNHNSPQEKAPQKARQEARPGPETAS
jgi:CBS domain containing-hemolysin-like protein